MTVEASQALRSRAEEWLGTARLAAQDGHRNAAYECARRAAELAGKALLQRKVGEYPKIHEIQGALAKAGLVPSSISPVALSGLLSDFTRGTYGFNEPVSDPEVSRAMRIASRMVEHASR